MPAPQPIIDLAERFERNLAAYKSGQYNETQARREFIDPFFEALGWDVNNIQGYAEAYKDVIHEDAVKVGGVTKAPDYSFRIGGTRKFFVEAKKPSVQIKDDPAPAFQVRRYAWSAKLPLSIVTDFEELAVYDCRVKPDQKDRADKARISYYTFRQYADKWDEIAAIFSRDAILKGSFDKYAESHKAKRGTSEVDSAFLAEIESWRDTLARNIALRNTLSCRELNEAVQRTIDRIIFLRIAEDRGIEEYGTLRGICNGQSTFVRLRELFYKADDRYNSGLFHFRHEKGEAEPPDNLTISLVIDDKPLKDILKRLYYPDSPYEFSVLPADILGQVYEQFLGKVIRLTSDHRAVVEDKPEVKKAGGVFYTPAYIVDYIVKNTVGPLVGATPRVRPPLGGTGSKGDHKDAPPRKITPTEASKLRILDPACGSGSFLLGAYQYLLDWHLQWYMENDPDKWAKAKEPRICTVGAIPCVRPPLGGDGSKGDHKDAPLQTNYRLTTAERKRILLNNIYGVDIDSQAVEVTKLSLLLKVLEGETGETLSQQMRLFHERALPDLGSNIKCGNSLIGPDFYDGKQMGLMGDEEMYRVNVFDWQREFPEVFAPQRQIPLNPPFIKGDLATPPFDKGGPGGISSGGFDAVIGNPPYIRIQALKEWAPKEVEFYKECYKSAQKGNYDIYVVFVEKGLQLLGKNGRLGYILPHKFFNAQYGEPLRKHLAEGRHLADIVHFGDKQIFANATTYTCLLFLEKQAKREFSFEKVTDLEAWRDFVGAIPCVRPPLGGESNKGDHKDAPLQTTIPAASVTATNWNFSADTGSILFEKLAAMPMKLGDVANIFVGLQTSSDKVYVLEAVSAKTDELLTVRTLAGNEIIIERDAVKPFLYKETFVKCSQPAGNHWLVFPYDFISGKAVLVDILDYQHRFPYAWNYLKTQEPLLKARENGKVDPESWHGYIYRKNLTLFDTPKLIVQVISQTARYAVDSTALTFTGGGNGPYYGIRWRNSEHSNNLLYLAGLLNSRLVDACLHRISSPFRGGYWSYGKRFIEQLPIRAIDFTNPTDKASHDRMVQLVEQMLSLHKQLPQARTGHDQTHLQRQIDATDRQIDKLVYELYGLTEEEIAVVEGKP